MTRLFLKGVWVQDGFYIWSVVVQDITLADLLTGCKLLLNESTDPISPSSGRSLLLSRGQGVAHREIKFNKMLDLIHQDLETIDLKHKEKESKNGISPDERLEESSEGPASMSLSTLDAVFIASGLRGTPPSSTATLLIPAIAIGAFSSREEERKTAFERERP